MASEQDIRRYLAYWFQLGKRVLLNDGQQSQLPRPVIQGDRYSQEFERCWQDILSPASGDCYLEGTEQTIDELLSPQWEVSPCARCQMPVPVTSLGMPSLNCPCAELPNWPNFELPSPRSPLSSSEQLQHIRERLLKIG